MKKQVLNIGNSSLGRILLLLIAIWTVSCSDDTLIDTLPAEEGLVDMEFSISAPAHDKIISSRVADFAIQNFYLFVFDEQGNIISQEYQDNLNINDQNEHSIGAKVPIGKAYIYGFANINTNVYGNLKSDLDGIQNREQLMNLSVSIQPTAMNLQRAGATWLMAGTCTDSKEVEYCTIQKGTSAVRSILLKRIDSEITFHFKEGRNCTLFKATNWYCVNAPAKSHLVEHKADKEASSYGSWDASDNEADYFSTLSQIGNNTIHDNAFTFYMPENRKIAKKPISSYNEREEEAGTIHECDENGKRNYVNAPDNATYVVVNGSFEGTTNVSTTEGLTGNQQVSATVTYVIHLGYVGRSAKDFFSNRNTKYTYNVTINGVDDIVVEVETGEETAPGATGEVIFQSGSNIYQLDAHYETVLLKFSLKDLVSKYGNNTQTETDRKFRCIVSTPYSNMSGVDAMKDKAWVKVARNEYASTDLQDYRNATLMTVDDLLEELEKAVNSYVTSGAVDLFTKQGDDYVVTYTCFVDEYYYDESDLPVSPSALRDNINIWKSFANQPDRKMYLVCNTQNSADQESSIISAAYILSQRSIKTFYSTEPGSSKVIAYGIETLNETGKLPWGLETKDASFESCNSIYGWNNTNYLFNNRNWKSVVNVSMNGYTTVEQNGNIVKGNANLKIALNSNFQKAYIACMQRNRNESKTDNITDKDIKWYLPSIDQYQSFYIGEAALADARLFNYPSKSPIGTFQDEVHYASSTFDGYNDRDGNRMWYDTNSFRVLWAEEGASTSTFNQATNAWRYNDIYSIHYRCVRNLGTVENPYNNFFEENNHTITYSKLNDATKDRSKVTNGELGVHDFNSGNNRYYKGGFEIYQGEMPSGKFKEVVTDDIYTGCQDIEVKAGEARWRAPNLREFTLIVLSGDNCIYSDYVFARTKYADLSKRIGWRILQHNIGMQVGDTWGKIRCVRDVN